MGGALRHRIETLARVRRRLGWWLGSHTGAMILLYHRIAELRPDPWAQGVSPARFAEQLAVLKKHTHVMPLTELVEAMGKRRLPRRGVAITFDDGYADNSCAAKPLLERHDVPATFFLIAEGPGPGREFWWDELEQLVWQTPELLPPLRLTIRGEECVLSSEGDRKQRYLAIWSRLKVLCADERSEIMAQLRAWSGVTPIARPTHRTMSAEELAGLAASALIEIGAHTVTHPSLPALSPQAQYEEIARSKTACEALTGRPPAGFAYPYGDATSETSALARKAGFRYAGAVSADVVRHHSDPFLLPRVPVRDWDGDEFARRLLSGFLRR